MATQAQVIANRANAQLSTGPRTEAGKARAAQNAQRSGLFAALDNLAPPLRARYDEFHARFESEFSAVTGREIELLSRLALAAFRCDRALILQMGFFQEKVRQLCERRAIPIPDDPSAYMRLEAVVLAEDPGAIRAADRLLRWQQIFEREMMQTHEALSRLIADRLRAGRVHQPPPGDKPAPPHLTGDDRLDALAREFGENGPAKTKPIAPPLR